MNLRRALYYLPYIIFHLFQKWHEEYRYEGYRQKYEIDPTFRFNGEGVLLYGNGRILLGPGSYIGRGSTIQAAEQYKVEIGARCAISHNVRIYTTSNLSDQDFSLSREAYHADVIIENDVWIGANVFINPGMTIGTNSIVGANSIVTKDVAPWSIVGGVPAKHIRNKMVHTG